MADELAIGEGLNILCGTFLSNVGLAVTEFAGKKKVFFLAAEPLTDKITWQDGNRYTFRLRPSTYMQVASWRQRRSGGPWSIRITSTASPPPPPSRS